MSLRGDQIPVISTTWCWLLRGYLHLTCCETICHLILLLKHVIALLPSFLYSIPNISFWFTCTVNLCLPVTGMAFALRIYEIETEPRCAISVATQILPSLLLKPDTHLDSYSINLMLQLFPTGTTRNVYSKIADCTVLRPF